MAEDKKSFLLYVDLFHTVEQMPREDAGELFLHILKYVNDQNPTSDNLIVKLTFEPIKQQLKRDLKVWEQIKIEKSEAGLLGNLKRWHNDLYIQVVDNQLSLSQASELVAQRQGAIKNIANIAVTVNDTVTVTDIVIKENKSGDKSPNLTSTLESRKNKFIEDLKSFVEVYGKEMVRKFFDYWSELNKSQTKMRWELEKTFEITKRLATWSSRDKTFSPKQEQDIMPQPKLKSIAEIYDTPTYKRQTS